MSMSAIAATGRYEPVQLADVPSDACFILRDKQQKVDRPLPHLKRMLRPVGHAVPMARDTGSTSPQQPGTAGNPPSFSRADRGSERYQRPPFFPSSTIAARGGARRHAPCGNLQHNLAAPAAGPVARWASAAWARAGLCRSAASAGHRRPSAARLPRSAAPWRASRPPFAI